ncbi:unnamed protein product [Nezara viridula]|uniref:Uncharacterized protein n=1 Tax=Nezara viridula TaxID=85310 RepID=A0A9P0E5V9_NEZVI|nr:unnamed protein product [Nezara viridula]
MFPDITCEECACIRLKKCLICCVNLKLGCIISAIIEVLVGGGYLAYGVLKTLNAGTGDWEAAFRSLVVIGTILTFLGILALFCTFKSENQENWLCLAYVLHILLGCVLGCIGMMVYPFKKIYYAVVFIAVEILLAGWTALVINSYRLSVMNWEPVKQEEVEGQKGSEK